MNYRPANRRLFAQDDVAHRAGAMGGARGCVVFPVWIYLMETEGENGDATHLLFLGSIKATHNHSQVTVVTAEILCVTDPRYSSLSLSCDRAQRAKNPSSIRHKS